MHIDNPITRAAICARNIAVNDMHGMRPCNKAYVHIPMRADPEEELGTYVPPPPPPEYLIWVLPPGMQLLKDKQWLLHRQSKYSESTSIICRPFQNSLSLFHTLSKKLARDMSCRTILDGRTRSESFLLTRPYILKNIYLSLFIGPQFMCRTCTTLVCVSPVAFTTPTPSGKKRSD